MRYREKALSKRTPAGGGNGGESGPARKGKGRSCPICGKPTLQDYRPFCSKRCADIDLGKWLGGSYSIPVVEEDGSADGSSGED